MRSIGVKDSNGVEIFEGDTVTFESNDVYFELDFINLLNIDTVTAYVVPQNGRVGSEVEFHFFSNGKEVYTYDKKYETLLEEYKDDQEKISEIHQWFENLDVPSDSVIKVCLSEREDTLGFTHQFIHQKKVITQTSDDKVKDFNVKELVLTFGGNTYSAFQSFKVKLTESEKKRALDVHNSLYEYEKFVGDFSHIIFTPKEVTLTSHSFKTEAVDENGNHTLYGVQESPEKRNREMTRILEPIREAHSAWKEENEPKLSKEEFEKQWEEKRLEYRKTLNELKEKEYKDDFLITDIFLGFGVSDDVLQFLFDNGCEITPI